MPEVSKEAFEAMPETNDALAATPDFAADQIQDDEGKKIKAILGKIEG